MLKHLAIWIVTLAPSALFAVGDSQYIYGTVGQTHHFMQKERTSGGFGQAGWGFKVGNHRIGLTTISRRIRNFKPKDSLPDSYLIESESIGIEKEYEAGPVSLGLSFEGGRLFTTQDEKIDRDTYRALQLNVGICFFANGYLRLYSKWGIFALRADPAWRDRMEHNDIEGGFFSFGIDINEPQKDF